MNFSRLVVKKKPIILIVLFVEEPLTTTQAPSTTEGYLPTPASNETETNFTVYIAGKTADEYRDEDVILEFKNALLTMAGNYCTQNMNVVLSDEITY